MVGPSPLFVWPSAYYLCVCVSVYVPLCLSVYLSICLFDYLSVYLSISVSVCISMFVCLPLYLLYVYLPDICRYPILLRYDETQSKLQALRGDDLRHLRDGGSTPSLAVVAMSVVG